MMQYNFEGNLRTVLGFYPYLEQLEFVAVVDYRLPENIITITQRTYKTLATLI